MLIAIKLKLKLKHFNCLIINALDAISIFGTLFVIKYLYHTERKLSINL